MFVANLLLLTHVVALPVAGAGIRLLWRDRALRPLAFAVVGVVAAYLALGGKSYYALPVVMFTLAVGAVPFDRWATPRRLRVVGAAFVALLVLMLPIGLPVLPLHAAAGLHVLDARSDYADEVGWSALATQVERLSSGADVVIAANYGEAGALEVFGRGLPPVASPHVTFRFWRPRVHGRRAALVGFDRLDAAAFCGGYRVVGRIGMPVDNEERGRPIARCMLRGPLAAVWPRVVALVP
jgi:hypothetical protein